ncbi:MAG: 2-oxoacid:acceptor oxidoreductase family protein [Clostridia bacterium]|nr:2-oxoacid:acceptor oxidoreductase family protein [Clostridia bacterium]MDD4375510.1 2-oxoacid:acceptor oxidoreductase family protein [Clostridia bacterium]
MIEIRWHGRGGQGAKTASLLLADVAFSTGKFIQGFPEYGPERMGAPLTAYNRIDDKIIRIHSNIYEPDYVVVVDDTLINSVDVTQGLKETGGILINSSLSPDEVRKTIPEYRGAVYTVDATKISHECLKANFPNTALLSAVIKITNLMNREDLEEHMLDSFKTKFAKKPEVIEPNMNAVRRAYDEVKGGNSYDK